MFTFTATDTGCGVNATRYRIDGGSWTEYSGGFTLPEGDHNISYYSNDNLNNTEQVKWREVTVPGAPPSVEANYKPLVALVFAIILAVVGIWSSKKKPWKGGKERTAKAFTVFSLPFVLAEVANGVFSSLTGVLSIPPLIGIGTAVDLVILLAGLGIAVLSVKPPRAEVTDGLVDR